MGGRVGGPQERQGHLHPCQRRHGRLPLHGPVQPRPALHRHPVHGGTAFLADLRGDATATDGRYDFTVHGADGFVRRFAGTVVRAEQDDVAVPSVQAKPRNGGHRETASIELKLINDGGAEVAFTITPNDFGGKPQTVWVGPGGHAQPTWAGNGGRYDFTVTAGTGDRFAQRYVGTLHDV
ncbi:phospholipase domain-containing protein [Streptosporangium lutulentum]